MRITLRDKGCINTTIEFPQQKKPPKRTKSFQYPHQKKTPLQQKPDGHFKTRKYPQQSNSKNQA